MAAPPLPPKAATTTAPPSGNSCNGQSAKTTCPDTPPARSRRHAPRTRQHCRSQLYTPREFAALLETADATLRPIIAIGGLAGLRTAELLRLDWADVWRVPGHIEVTAGKAKTRQRRLVKILPRAGRVASNHSAR
jgi:integrase